MGKGVTLTKEELVKLRGVLSGLNMYAFRISKRLWIPRRIVNL